jgi:DNA-binding CsgD family transcriptional regulator/tetratricopeptide (TPR) repeat protein
MVGDRRAADLPEISTPAFVGREREVAVLRNALSRPPAVVLVEAESGGGKSRLMQEFLATADSSMRRTLVAVCPPFREALTLGPVVDAIRRSHDDVSGLCLSALAGALRPLFPEWAEALPPSPAPLDDAKAARHRLFRALAELVSAAEITGLVVEDVHWADGITLEFLLYLASHQQAGAPSLVLTYRPEEVTSGSPLRRLTARLPAGTTQVRIGLAPLDLAGTAGMVSSMLYGEPVAPDLAGYLHTHTDGVPLAVEESVRLLRDRDDLVRRDGLWIRRSGAALRVSPTIRDSVQERVQRLGGPAQQVLRAAAVLGEASEPRVVAGVAALPAAEVEPALNEAIASGLLREDDRGRLTFRHVFLEQAVYQAVTGTERRRLHLRAGRALEATHPPPVAQLTRHFREANEVAQWCRYAEQAAARAVASDDRTTATALLNDVLAVAELPGPVRLRLANQLGAVALSRGEDVDELHHHVVRTVRTVLVAGGLTVPEQAQIRNLLGRLLVQQGELTAAQAELEQAAPHLVDDPVQAARAMTYLGWPQNGSWPAEVHAAWLRRAAEMLPRIVSPVDRLALTVDRATALLMLGDESGWAVTAELPTDPPDAQTRFQVARGCLNIGYASIVWGRYDEARHRLEAGAKLADAGQNWRHFARLQLALADLDWLTGVWEGLEARADAMLDSDVADPMLRLMATRLAGRLQAARGTARRAERQLEQVLAEARAQGAVDDVVTAAADVGRLHLTAGRVDEALRVTLEPFQLMEVKGAWVWATELATVRVEALVTAGRRAEAAALATAYAQGLHGRRAPAARAGLANCRAILSGDPAAYARAARAWERLPRPYEALLARERQASGLLAAGRPGPGLALLHQVWQGLLDLGARRDADRLAQLLRQHGSEVRHPWRGGRRGYGTELSPREQEVVRLVLAGKTNREIAQMLHKSPRTVAGQLGSVMRKLGVSSRTELAVRVVEAGLVPGED